VVKHIRVSGEMAGEIKRYCLENGIRYESGLIKQAISAYIHPDIKDRELGFLSLTKLQQLMGELSDHNEIMMKYIRAMHIDILSYLDGGPDSLRGAALVKAKERYNRFFGAFQKGVTTSGSFFDRLLERYVSGGEGKDEP